MPRRRTALVTGSTNGIGLAIAAELAAHGHNLMLNSFGDAAHIASVRAELACTHGVDVLHDGADMGRPDAIEGMLDRATRQWGGIDVLVNNAGIRHVAPVDEFPVDQWNAILAINLSAAFHTTRLALPHMKFNRWGRIVNIASAHALMASPFESASAAAKHGMAGFTKAVALEVAETGITANAVCPGCLLTPWVETQIPDTARARGATQTQDMRDVPLAAQPARRFVSSVEVARWAAYLCRDAAASITGSVMPIDIGWTAH